MMTWYDNRYDVDDYGFCRNHAIDSQLLYEKPLLGSIRVKKRLGKSKPVYFRKIFIDRRS